MYRINYKLLLITAFCMLSALAHAQIPGPMGDMLQKLQQQAGRELSYDYKVILEDVQAGIITDSLKGHLNAGHKRFTDSNAVFTMARNGKWYCKVNHGEKTVSVYNEDELSKAMKLPFTDEGFNNLNITAETIADFDGQTAIDTSNKNFYRIRITLRNYTVSYLQLDLERKSYQLIAAAFSSDEKDGREGGYHYRKTYYISHVHYDPGNQAFDLSRIFTVQPSGQIRLQKPYTAYRLTQPLLAK